MGEPQVRVPMSRVEVVVVVKVTVEKGVDPNRVAEEIKAGVDAVVRVHPWLVRVETEYLGRPRDGLALRVN